MKLTKEEFTSVCPPPWSKTTRAAYSVVVDGQTYRAAAAEQGIADRGVYLKITLINHNLLKKETK